MIKYLPIFRNIRTENSGQIVTLMGAIILVTVVTLTSAYSGISNVGVTVPMERSQALTDEFLNIINNFGISLNYNLVNITNETDSLNLTFHGRVADIEDAFNKTYQEFSNFELQYGNTFIAKYYDYEYVGYNFYTGRYVYDVNVYLSLSNGRTYIQENTTYRIILEFYL